MTNREALRERIEAAAHCDCEEAWTSRGLVASSCARHSLVDWDTIMDIVTERETVAARVGRAILEDEITEQAMQEAAEPSE